MPTNTKQAGFSFIELVLILVVVGLLGFLGYSFYNSQINKTANNSSPSLSTVSSESAKANDVASVPVISSTSDLDKASATLDQTDPGGSNNADGNQLGSQLDNF